MIPYKDDNPSEKFPIVTVILIAINVAVFLFWKLQPAAVYQQAIFQLGMVPYEVWKGVNLPFSVYLEFLRNLGMELPPGSAQPLVPQFSPYFTIFTSMFMHSGWMHIAGNMLFLWIFGNNVEDYLGHIKYLLLYLCWGLVAAGAHLLANPGSMIPTVGASGAISGVLGAYLILFPWARIHVLVPLFFYFFTTTLPAWFMLLFWFFFQLIAAVPASGGAGVAYWAHIGGFAAGAAYMLLFKRKPVPRPYGFRTRATRGFYR